MSNSRLIGDLLRHFFVASLHLKKSSSQKDLQTGDLMRTFAKEEPSSKPKLSRRDCLQLIFKEERLKSSEEKKPSPDIEETERQLELEKEMQEAENNEYVYRSEMSTGIFVSYANTSSFF